MTRFQRNRKGFTLIEMLVVIAIIAVLVAIIIPTVSNATKKARAAADAANLRSVLGQANVLLMTNDASTAAAMADIQYVKCSTFPGAVAKMAYVDPGFMVPYFVNGDNYYSLMYFSDVAGTGESEEPTTRPTDADYTWYNVGGEK